MESFGTTSTVDDGISGSLEKLVDHYSQSVHQVHEVDKAPYFDPLLGHPLRIPPVLQYLLDSLIAGRDDGILDCINAYTTSIRPVTVKKSLSCIAVLQHYEILVSQWTKHVTSNNKSNENNNSDISTTKSKIFHTIQVISSDITLFTAPSEIDLSPHNRCNIVIPCLLRLLSHIFRLLDFWDMKEGVRPCIIRCVVSLLAFDAQPLDPRTIATSLSNFHVGLIDRLCACPPVDRTQYNAIDNLVSLEESIDWKSVSIDDAPWMDKVTGVTSRAVYGLWKNLIPLLDDSGSNLTSNQGGVEKEVKDANNLSHGASVFGHDIHAVSQAVVNSLDIMQLAKAVRQHFFGLDLHEWEPETRLSTQVIMGRRIAKTEPVLKDKPFIIIPSRVHVAIALLRHLEEHATIANSRDLLVQLMPIVFELLDAASAGHIALGACSLIHLLDLLQPSMESIQGFAEPAMAALDLDLTSRREGPVLFLIGQAQIRLIPCLDEASKRRRQLTRRWFSLLYQASSRPSTTNICLELLVGGIIPLLFQHSQQPNADAMELGRSGLSAILPVLESEFMDDNVKAAALIALINLIIGAYPMMPYHGGKIISTIIASALASRAALAQEGDASDLRGLFIHAGAVAVIVCGEKYAGAVLNDLERDQKDYQEEMIAVLGDIKMQARILDESE